MDARIKEILDELYVIDISFKKNETELIKIITKMIDGKPDTHFSETFKLELREKILKQINSWKVIKSSIFDNFFKNFSLILSWAIIASFFILTIFPQIINNNKPEWNLSFNNSEKIWLSNFEVNREKSANIQDKTTDNQTREIEKIIDWTWIADVITGVVIEKSTVIPNTVKNIKWTDVLNKSNYNKAKNAALVYVNINRVGDNAFGKISNSSNNNSFWWSAWAVSKSNPEISNLKTMDSVTSPNSITTPTNSKILSNDYIQNETIQYTYSYTWELEWLNNAKVNLLKKVKTEYNNPSLLSYLKNLNLWWFDLKNTLNPKITSFNFNEDREYWLEYNVNLSDSNITIGKNYTKWPQTSYKDNVSSVSSQIKLSDLPDDKKIIDLANDVIKKYNIDLKNYSKPFVNNDWKKEYEKSEDKSSYYIPDIIEVVFPIIIDWKNVYEEYGQIKWLRIWFDVKTLKLAQITWIESLSLDSSSYDKITDKTKILEYIAKWWRNSSTLYNDSDSKVKTITLHLWKPTLEYVHIFDYNNWVNSEYFVPAYIFETIEKPKDWEYFQEKVIVPLVKDIFESNSQIMR